MGDTCAARSTIIGGKRTLTSYLVPIHPWLWPCASSSSTVSLESFFGLGMVWLVWFGGTKCEYCSSPEAVALLLLYEYVRTRTAAVVPRCSIGSRCEKMQNAADRCDISWCFCLTTRSSNHVEGMQSAADRSRDFLLNNALKQPWVTATINSSSRYNRQNRKTQNTAASSSMY